MLRLLRPLLRDSSARSLARESARPTGARLRQATAAKLAARGSLKPMRGRPDDPVGQVDGPGLEHLLPITGCERA
jgi:hypothetical protein